MRGLVRTSSHGPLYVNKADLLLLTEELGVAARKSMRKPELVEAITKCGAETDEVEERWQAVCQRKLDKEIEGKLKELQLRGSQSASDVATTTAVAHYRES